MVALYKQTCDGVPDLAAAIKKVVARHKIDYTVLNMEAGKVSDPTGGKYPWAPYALIVDRQGRLVQEYGHMPPLDSVQKDVEILLATGRIPPVPATGWQAWRRGSWVKVRFDEPGERRLATRRLSKIARGSVVLEVEIEHGDGRRTSRNESVSATRRVPDDSEIKRKELKPEALSIDGKRFPCRVIEASWVRTKRSGEKLRVLRRSWVANDPTLPDTLLRRETTERLPGGAVVKRTRRIRSFSERVEIGDAADEREARQVTCWVVESVVESSAGLSETRSWLSKAVPGHEVKSFQRIVSQGRETRISSTVVDFAGKE